MLAACFKDQFWSNIILGYICFSDFRVLCLFGDESKNTWTLPKTNTSETFSLFRSFFLYFFLKKYGFVNKQFDIIRNPNND